MKLRISQALDRGLSLMVSGRLEEAKKIYQTILKFDPNHSEANHKMGLISIESGSFKESIRFLKRAIKAKPQESRYWKEHLKSSIRIQDEDKTALILEALKQIGIDSKVLSEFKEKIRKKTEKNIRGKHTKTQGKLKARRKGEKEGAKEEGKEKRIVSSYFISLHLCMSKVPLIGIHVEMLEVKTRKKRAQSREVPQRLIRNIQPRHLAG